MDTETGALLSAFMLMSGVNFVDENSFDPVSTVFYVGDTLIVAYQDDN